jgi:hypothetical protein
MGYHIPMIDLGKSEKVTAVLKLLYFVLNAWSCLELSFLEIIFTFLQSLIHRTQDKLVSQCDFDCHFTFLSPYYYLKGL